MTTDADPKAASVADRLAQLEDRASRLTGAVWFMLDAQLALIERLGALAGDPSGFRAAFAGTLETVNRKNEAQLSPRAKATYGDLMARLREGPPSATPYVSPDVERTKLPS